MMELHARWLEGMHRTALILALVAAGCGGRGDAAQDRASGGSQTSAPEGGQGAGASAGPGDFGNTDGKSKAVAGSGSLPGLNQSGGAGGAGVAGTGSSAGAGGAAGATPTPMPNVSGVEPATIDQCPGSLAQGDVDTLRAGGSVDPLMRFLYPYEDTVFPRGLEPPLLQWDAPTATTDAVYVHLSSNQFDYKGCFGATALGQATIPVDVWDAAFRASEGVADPLAMEVTTMSGGVVSGPIATRVTLARATLKGAIFYNTYSSLVAVSQGVLNGVVMRVTPGRPTPEVFVTAQTPSIAGDICVGCHSVSANGTRMVVEEHAGVGTVYNTSLSYSLTANQTPKPPVQSQLGNSKAAFSAVYPDGSRFLTTGRPEIGPFSTGMSINGTFGIEPAALWDADTGTEIPNTGIPQYAKMPMFNPDGDMVAFNDQDAAGALAVMDFDGSTNKFDNWRQLATDPAYIGWPFFLPDNSGVVFATTDAPGYTAMAGGDLTGTVFNPGHLKVVHIDSGAVVPLARAMGYRNQAMTDAYVPYGDRDLDVDYLPTVSPVAAGGYFWMFFTSKRNYGNVKANPILTVDAKKIWVSAISIPGSAASGYDLAAGEDPSHPAFLLPGQELESGNIRAFAALNPCLPDGESCETGIDCCGGFCTDGVCGLPPPPDPPPGDPPPDPPPPRCSNFDERCETVDDCCNAELSSVKCIAGFCAYAPVVD